MYNVEETDVIAKKKILSYKEYLTLLSRRDERR